MDDTRSRQQIDELADLYLTDSDPVGSVSGPAPIKLGPKLGGQSSGQINDDDAAGFDPFDDSHPVLRLTEDEAEELIVGRSTLEEKTVSDTVYDDEPAPRAVLEAVLMGNLPGMSGPWLTQYAQLLAQSEGPVVLLHIGEAAIDLELVEPRAEAQPAPVRPATTVRIPPMRSGKTGLVGLIDALVRSDANPARTILVRFDTFSDAQTLSRLAAMDDWTLLCGSDSASIAAASRSLRNAVHNDPRLADRSVGVMIMGSDDDAAEQAANRIAGELVHDLANPVELVGHLRRMQPVQVRDLGSFPDPVALWPKLVSFFDSLEVPEPLAEPEPIQVQAPSPEPMPAPPKAAQLPPRVEPQPQAPTRRAPRPAASRPEPMPRSRQARPKTTPTPTPMPTPVPMQRQQAAAQQAARQKAPDTIQRDTTPRATTPMRPAPTPRVLAPKPELDLIALLNQGPAALDNPVVLDARVPEQPDTQLAVDAQGVVHLLKKGSGVVSDDVMQLIEAGHWVADHLELIALTQRDHDFVDTKPMLHLLTDRADLTTQVVGKLAGQIKLHLLQQVTLGRETGWFCTPLG